MKKVQVLAHPQHSSSSLLKVFSHKWDWSYNCQDNNMCQQITPKQQLTKRKVTKHTFVFWRKNPHTGRYIRSNAYENQACMDTEASVWVSKWHIGNGWNEQQLALAYLWCENKCSPVDANGMLGSDVSVDIHCLCRVYVLRAHEPPVDTHNTCNLQWCRWGGLLLLFICAEDSETSCWQTQHG